MGPSKTTSSVLSVFSNRESELAAFHCTRLCPSSHLVFPTLPGLPHFLPGPPLPTHLLLTPLVSLSLQSTQMSEKLGRSAEACVGSACRHLSPQSISHFGGPFCDCPSFPWCLHIRGAGPCCTFQLPGIFEKLPEAVPNPWCFHIVHNGAELTVCDIKLELAQNVPGQPMVKVSGFTHMGC